MLRLPKFMLCQKYFRYDFIIFICFLHFHSWPKSTIEQHSHAFRSIKTWHLKEKTNYLKTCLAPSSGKHGNCLFWTFKCTKCIQLVTVTVWTVLIIHYRYETTITDDTNISDFKIMTPKHTRTYIHTPPPPKKKHFDQFRLHHAAT